MRNCEAFLGYGYGRYRHLSPTVSRDRPCNASVSSHQASRNRMACCMKCFNTQFTSGVYSLKNNGARATKRTVVWQMLFRFETALVTSSKRTQVCWTGVSKQTPVRHLGRDHQSVLMTDNRRSARLFHEAPHSISFRKSGAGLISNINESFRKYRNGGTADEQRLVDELYTVCANICVGVSLFSLSNFLDGRPYRLPRAERPGSSAAGAE